MRRADYERLHGGGNFVSSDRHPGRVRALLGELGMGYPSPFVSVAVLAASGVAGGALLGYGTVTAYLRMERVLGDVVVVAADDLQDAAFARRPHVRAVDGNTSDRLATLHWAAVRAPSAKYAEARLARPLVLEDVADFDVSGDFDLNLQLNVGR